MGLEPALDDSNASDAIFRRRNSAKMLRAEFPVHRNKILNCFISAALGFEGFGDPPRFLFHLLEALKVCAESLVRLRAVLEALQVGLEFGCPVRGQAVNHPVGMPSCLHHSVLTKVGELLGNFYLGGLKDALEVTHAERPVRQEVNDAQPGCLAKALVDLDKFHVGNMSRSVYMSICI